MFLACKSSLSTTKIPSESKQVCRPSHIHKSKHRYGRQESMYWWPKYEEVKLRKKEKLRGQRPLNTGGAKLSRDRCCYGKACRSHNSKNNRSDNITIALTL